MNRNRISALLFIAVGAVLGHIAATGHFTFHRSAGAQNVPAGIAGQEAPQASCSEGLNKAKLLAMAGPSSSGDTIPDSEKLSVLSPELPQPQQFAGKSGYRYRRRGYGWRVE